MEVSHAQKAKIHKNKLVPLAIVKGLSFISWKWYQVKIFVVVVYERYINHKKVSLLI